jgi:hydrogenase-1 operon protein HyaF
MGGLAMTTIIRPNFRKPRVAEAVFREIAAMMECLLTTGETGTIDLRSLPMTDLDRIELAGRLGDGEVRAFINAGGTSTVFETQFAGVWWIRHEDHEGRALAEQIAVAHVPEMLLANPGDISASHARLSKLLASGRDEQLGEAANV